jgi:hypothetical protein
MKSNSVTVLITSALILALGTVQADGQDVKALMSSYIDALIDEDYDGAAQFWHPQYIETCSRLGITYRDVPYKYDCTSPLLQNMAAIRDGSASWTITQTLLAPQQHKVILKIRKTESKVSYDYFFFEFYRNESQLNDFALFDLDQYIELTLMKLGASKEMLETLKERRMEYYLAGTENEVSELLGFSSRGMFFAPSDIIISRYLPDYHELALFALSYTQENLGMYTAPFIRQGLACSFGGRFGQTKEVMPQIANFTLANDIYALGDVLTVGDFHTKIGSIDFSYPLSLGLVETLTERYNITGTLKLLSDLSGSMIDVAGWTSDDVKTVITGFTGKTWSEIETYSKEKIASDPLPNLKPGVTSAAGQTVFESGTTEYLARITHNEGWYDVKLTPHSPDTRIEGTIVIKGPVGNTYDEFKSFLWKEQFPDEPYFNQLYSIRYNPDEIGVYDYLTNRLVAKYVLSFDDGNKLVNEGEMSFRFSENVLRDHISSYHCHILETLNDR